MTFSTLDNLLWAAGFVGQLALLCVLVYRKRWKGIPVFTSLMAYEVALTIVLFLIYTHGSRSWYARVYWFSVFFDFCLQLGVAVEIARIVLRPTGTWIQDAKRQFILLSVVGIAIAAVLAWLVSPPTSRQVDLWEIRANLFTSLVICEMFVAMAMTANSLGLAWRSHVMAIGQGLTLWVCFAVVVDVLHAHLGKTHDFLGLEHLRMLVYLSALGFWIGQLWRDEPARRPISPELQARILALHRRVQYDVNRLGI